jgi:2'-hydroxyisoflavone reductase
MKLLIIGGTVFLGRALVEAAVARGHEITLFNRGQHNPDLFPEVEKLRGNRDGELEVLQGRTWDAVLDTCGYFPRVVRQSAQALADSAGHYTFISSISAYSDFSRPLDEQGSLGQIEAEEAEAADKITNENYGPLKVRCEQEVEQAFPGRTLVLRPGIIVGPHDPSDRFTYWPWRVARGGEVLVPGKPEQRVEIIDVRDLAEWNIRMVEENGTGIYNTTGPDYPLTMQHLLETCRTALGGEAGFVYVPGEFLKEQEVEPNAVHCWWLPENVPEYQYFWEVDCRKALADGLRHRPLADIARDTLAWAATRPDDWKWRTGLASEQESRLLEAWQKQTQRLNA